MQLNTIKRTHPNKKIKTVGRGGKHAKTSGRGTKGQNARAGHKKRPEMRDFIKRIPKLRGRGKNINTSIQSPVYVVNLKDLEKSFKTGDTVSPETLLKAGLVKRTAGVMPKIKILGLGSITIKITVSGCSVSAGAKKAIEDVSGNII